MTPTESRLWAIVNRRASLLTPELVAQILVAFEFLRSRLSDSDLARAIELGYAEAIVAQVVSDATLQAAMQPVRDTIRRGVIQSVQYFQREIPPPPGAASRLGVSFDSLNPRIVDAIRELETKVIDTLKDDLREVVRTIVERGLRDGIGPRSLAAALREVIGLAPSQEIAVSNLRRELENGDYADAARRQLIDRRFNLSKLDELTAPARAARVNTIVDAYRKAYVAFNAETNARTSALDAMKLGQRLSWQDAIAQGVVDGGRLMKRWVGVKDSRERPEHLAMEGETVPFDARFSNGELVCGDSTFNCRCVPVYFLAPAA